MTSNFNAFINVQILGSSRVVNTVYFSE